MFIPLDLSDFQNGARSAKTVVNGEDMILNESRQEDDLVCLTCLTAIDASEQAKIIECYQCRELTYIVDVLNEQENQLHVARCSECNAKEWVRVCRGCGIFYHPGMSEEVYLPDGIFCGQECADCLEPVP